MLRLFEGRTVGNDQSELLAPWVEPEAPEQAEPIRDFLASEPEPNPAARAQNAKQTIAFCSANGSVGQTSLCINVAFELALAGKSVALVDFDVESPSILTALNQNSITAGLAGVVRLLGQGRFEPEDLSRFLMVLNFDGVRFSVLPGLAPPLSFGDSPSLITESVRSVMQTISADFVILDLPAAARSPDLTKAALELSDLTFGVCAGDPVSIKRYLWFQEQLRKFELKNQPHLIVNRVRDSVLGANAKRQIADTFERVSQTDVTAFVPEDSAAFDLALREGLPLQLVKKASPARHAISMLVRQGILGQRSQLDWRVARNG